MRNLDLMSLLDHAILRANRNLLAVNDMSWIVWVKTVVYVINESEKRVKILLNIT